MAIDFNTNFGCGDCGTCICNFCDDKKIPLKLSVNFTGLLVQDLLIDTDCNGTNDVTTVMDLTSLNGDHDLDLIYHNGQYATGYDTDAMGEVSSRGGAPGDCISCYEATFTGLGDIYRGGTGGCVAGVPKTADETKWLRNVNLRLRVYIDPGSGVIGAFGGGFGMIIVSIVPDGSGGFIESGSSSVYGTWDPNTDEWFCTEGGEFGGYSDDFDFPSPDPTAFMQFLDYLFWSDTDTCDLGSGETNVIKGTSGGADDVGDAQWTFTASTDRVTTVS